jgi:Flp pilus assembly protein TadD
MVVAKTVAVAEVLAEQVEQVVDHLAQAVPV